MLITNMEQNEIRPTIGITIGDFNGIGPEVILKTLADTRITKNCKIIIYGSGKVLAKYKKIFSIESVVFHTISQAEQAADKKINLINCWEDNLEVEPGKMTQEAGRAAYLALARCTEDLKNRHVDAVVTAPINKLTIQSSDFPYPGHTEYYAANFAKEDSMMLLVSEVLRVGNLTTHIPLSQVSEHITQEKIIKKTNLLLKVLKEDFGIRKPKIAILGLNPHAGEGGLLGAEENNVIVPAIQVLKEKGHLVHGAYPTDGFFGSAQYKKYDAVLAMYHDQGLTPFKMLSFEDGVNFTAGLSIVRTSPDHGTAYDIAGKGVADENSFRAALFLACDTVKHRYWTRIEKDSKEREKSIREKEKDKFRAER
jgi:4-hydroxythreonine-4-phosphate dehydrogenase